MRDVGMKITPGSGVAAAQEYWRSTAKPLAKRELPPRAPDAQPAAGPAQGEGHRGRGSMSHTRYEPARPRLQRSELAVPGSQPAMFPKALESEVDYVFLDLEDAVAPGRQGAGPAQRDPGPARARLARRRARRSASGSTGSTPTTCTATWWTWWSRRGIGWTRCSSPRSGVPADVYLVDALLTQIEEAKGIEHRIGIDVLIETALGMANVEAIAQSSRRLEAMHFGVADYAASCRARTVSIGGLNPDYPGDQWHAALSRMVVACRAYGLRADRRPLRRLQGSRTGTACGAERGRGAWHRGQVGDSPQPDRAGQRGVHPAAGGGGAGQADPGCAGGGGPRGAGGGAARRPDDRRRVGPDGAERGEHGGSDRDGQAVRRSGGRVRGQ